MATQPAPRTAEPVLDPDGPVPVDVARRRVLDVVGLITGQEPEPPVWLVALTQDLCNAVYASTPAEAGHEQKLVRVAREITVLADALGAEGAPPQLANFLGSVAGIYWCGALGLSPAAPHAKFMAAAHACLRDRNRGVRAPKPAPRPQVTARPRERRVGCKADPRGPPAGEPNDLLPARVVVS